MKRWQAPGNEAFSTSRSDTLADRIEHEFEHDCSDAGPDAAT